MEFSFLPSWPPAWPRALSIAALALLAVVFGEACARLLRSPRLIGHLLAGAAFGLAARTMESLHFESVPRAALGNALTFAAALVLFDLGQRVSFGWLRRNPALLGASVAESALAFGAVFAVLRLLDFSPLAAALAAAISLATSPGVVIAVTRELRSQGQVTERTLLLTALNSIYAVVLSTLLLTWAYVETRGVFDDYVLHPLYLVVGSLLLAAVGARLLLWVLRQVGRERAPQVMVMVAFVAVVYGVAQALALSPLLALLACGAFVRRRDASRRLASSDFGLVSAIALVLLFALSAASIDFALLQGAWLPALALLGARALAKLAVPAALAPVTGLSWRKGALTGVALLPMSTLALLLTLQVESVSRVLAAQVGHVVVAAAAMMVVTGALALAWSLRAAGEAGES